MPHRCLGCLHGASWKLVQACGQKSRPGGHRSAGSRPRFVVERRRVRENRGAAGVDRVMAYVQEVCGVSRLLGELQADLRAGTYHPAPARRADIPKPQGGTRDSRGHGRKSGSTGTACTGSAAPSAIRRQRNHAKKIIGKPYAGKPLVRIERGMGKRACTGTAPLTTNDYSCGTVRRVPRTAV